MLGMARVWGDSARGVAQYLPHYFHTTVEERFRRRGLREERRTAFEAVIREVGVRAGRSGETSSMAFRRHSEVFMSEHQFEHVEAALSAPVFGPVRLRMWRRRSSKTFPVTRS